MKILSATAGQLTGAMPQLKKPATVNPLAMNTLNERHMQIHSPGPVKESTFQDYLSGAIATTEQLAKQSEKLTGQAVIDPDSVEVHDVMIASQKSRFALNLTKTVTDGLVRAYRELTTGR